MSKGMALFSHQFSGFPHPDPSWRSSQSARRSTNPFQSKPASVPTS